MSDSVGSILNAGICQRVRSERLAKGLTLKETCEGLPFSGSRLSEFERGIRQWRLGNLEAVAGVLGVPVRSLFPVGAHEVIHGDPSPKPTCGNCRWWEREDTAHEDGLCHLRAPVMMSIDRDAHHVLPPQMCEAEWCGEHPAHVAWRAHQASIGASTIWGPCSKCGAELGPGTLSGTDVFFGAVLCGACWPTKGET